MWQRGDKFVSREQVSDVLHLEKPSSCDRKVTDLYQENTDMLHMLSNSTDRIQII